MKIEILEELVSEFLRKMGPRVTEEHNESLRLELLQQYDRIKIEFANLNPVLDRYTDYFQFDQLNSLREDSSQLVIQRVYENVIQIKRLLENGIDIQKIKQIQEPAETKTNSNRVIQIEDMLKDSFNKVYKEIYERDANVDIDLLKSYCYRIQQKGVETIEEDVFKKQEREKIEAETSRFLEEIEQEIRRGESISKDQEVKFVEGPVCPVVSDIDEFAKQSKEKIDETIASKETEKEDNAFHLPDNVIE